MGPTCIYWFCVDVWPQGHISQLSNLTSLFVLMCDSTNIYAKITDRPQNVQFWEPSSNCLLSDIWVPSVHGCHTCHWELHLGRKGGWKVPGVPAMGRSAERRRLLWVSDLLVLHNHPQHSRSNLPLRQVRKTDTGVRACSVLITFTVSKCNIYSGIHIKD